jgi:cell division cycle protein 37
MPDLDKPKAKAKATTTEIEVLNPKTSPPVAEAEDEGDEVLPSLTPSLLEFSKIPLRAYQASWDFISSHRDVVVPGASDALLVEAFRAERRGESEYAKKCVHQSLLLQYCDKLGGDGVRVFFKK